MRLGFHISIAGGLREVLPRARRRRCITVQLFTSSPVQWAQTALAPQECRRLVEQLAEHDIRPHFVHAAYLLNIASPDPKLWTRSVKHLGEELWRANLLEAAGVVLHLGSVGGTGSPDVGLKRVAKGLDAAREQAGNEMPLILENSAGAGNTVGATVAELAAIVGYSRCPEYLRVCLDTAHAFAAGWPVHRRRGLTQILDEIDNSLGRERLVLIHANDSKSELGSRVDRHWHIGRGKIGREGFKMIVNHPRLRHLPFIMETPGSEDDDLRNMRVLRRLIKPAIRPPLPPIPDVI